TILMLCVPDDVEVAAEDRLIRDYFGMHRLEWSDDDDAVEFHIGYGDWIRLLRRSGFEVEDLIEIQAPAGATTRYKFVTTEWARRWPSEEIWKARKRG
ncbi:MAG TPA: SAM-dependent methyltransferase, partial [bacterium]|nr:SAM-dependent methyltransferase [bacterium]